MKRRHLALVLAAAPLLPGLAQAAEPIEGKDYTRLGTPQPVAVPGKIEVIEFFGYWCPHCNAFEPSLEAWVKALPADVAFRRIPVGWAPPHLPYQKLYFALEAMGAPSDIHAKVFRAVHVQHLQLETAAGLAAFASANQLDKARLEAEMNSFTVATKIRAANQLFAAYHVDGVPTLAINGRFITSPELAGSEEQALKVADVLSRKSRSQR